ncbi:MAG: hypothetical protein CMN27_09255 [Salinisphaera sp.]|jgi:hypothetical protein|nr:hypothetical protein [Salinisphaera sp.]
MPQMAIAQVEVAAVECCELVVSALHNVQSLAAASAGIVHAITAGLASTLVNTSITISTWSKWTFTMRI